MLEVLVHLIGWALSADSPFVLDRERRRQIRNLLKAARKSLQEGKERRARAELDAALRLQPDTKALAETAEQLRLDLQA